MQGVRVWSGEQGPPGGGGGSPASLRGEGEGAIHSLPLKGEGCGARVRSLQAEEEKCQGPEAGAILVFGNTWG